MTSIGCEENKSFYENLIAEGEGGLKIQFLNS